MLAAGGIEQAVRDQGLHYSILLLFREIGEMPNAGVGIPQSVKRFFAQLRILDAPSLREQKCVCGTHHRRLLCQCNGGPVSRACFGLIVCRRLRRRQNEAKNCYYAREHNSPTNSHRDSSGRRYRAADSNSFVLAAGKSGVNSRSGGGFFGSQVWRGGI